MALEQNDRIVMGSLLVDTPALHVEKGVFSAAKDKVGYININADKMTSVVRSYYPFARINDGMQRSFTSEIVRLYDDQAYQNCDKERMRLKWSTIRPTWKIISTSPKNNCLIMTVRASSTNLRIRSSSWDSLRTSPFGTGRPSFHPMNPVFSGKSFPDMYGIVIHANILSMILSDQYINMASKNMSYVYAFIITFLFSLFIIKPIMEQ